MSDKHTDARGELTALDLAELEYVASKADPIYTDLYGDRYSQGSWSRVDLEKEQDDFITAFTPAVALQLIARIRATEGQAQTSAAICRGCDPAEGFCKQCRGKERAAQLADSTAPGAPVEPTQMTEEQAQNWAWKDLKKSLAPTDWNAGDSSNFFAFFLHGWLYRAQYERQRPALAAPTAQQSLTDGGAVPELSDAYLLDAFHRHGFFPENLTGQAKFYSAIREIVGKIAAAPLPQVQSEALETQPGSPNFDGAAAFEAFQASGGYGVDIGEYDGLYYTQFAVSDGCRIDRKATRWILSEVNRSILGDRVDTTSLAPRDWISVDDRLPAVGELVLVYSPRTVNDWPDSINIAMDYIDENDDTASSWAGHNNHYENFCCVAKPEGSTGPSEKAPYTHWASIPPVPTQDAMGHKEVAHVQSDQYRKGWQDGMQEAQELLSKEIADAARYQWLRDKNPQMLCSIGWSTAGGEFDNPDQVIDAAIAANQQPVTPSGALADNDGGVKS